MPSRTFSPGQQRKVFLFLVAYRWACLVPGLWLVISRPAGSPGWTSIALVFGAAVANTLLITGLHRRLNRALARYPYLLGVDMLLMAALLAVSGGENSPYYLYALSPVLAGAFFFQVRGALASAASFTPLYLLAIFTSQQLSGSSPEPIILISQVAGIWLIAILFGFSSSLLRQLKEARDVLAQQNLELGNTHQQLKIIHDLTTSLQSAVDVQTVQARVLQAVTEGLGFRRAVIGLANPFSERLENWLSYPAGQLNVPPASYLPLDEKSGILAQKLLADPKPVLVPLHETLTVNPTLNDFIGSGPWLLIPLVLREQPVGILLVDGEAGGDVLPDERMSMLAPVASQAAVALGTTLMCIDRAERLAVERERNRIARDIHDTVAQSLFGIVFTLDACVSMLPDQAQQVKRELIDLKGLASNTHQQVRRSIFDLWSPELPFERFKAELTSHASQCASPRSFQLVFKLQGDFDSISSGVRRSLYQIAQESLANVARHADVDFAEVCLSVETDWIMMSIQDWGKGFDPGTARMNSLDSGRFGLRSIQERVQELGWELEIHSAAGQGTQVIVRAPLG
jgi:signal transduction histidine kinase